MKITPNWWKSPYYRLDVSSKFCHFCNVLKTLNNLFRKTRHLELNRMVQTICRSMYSCWDILHGLSEFKIFWCDKHHYSICAFLSQIGLNRFKCLGGSSSVWYLPTQCMYQQVHASVHTHVCVCVCVCVCINDVHVLYVVMVIACDTLCICVIWQDI